VDREAYTTADITVLSFQDSVRNRTGMYFGVEPHSPDLATNILRGVIDDALHPAGGGAHRTVDIEVTADLRFTVTDDQPRRSMTSASRSRASTIPCSTRADGPWQPQPRSAATRSSKSAPTVRAGARN
jgi:DNA gyrase/topoisomerase IV subunit B